jgi:hypothetical protein
VERRQIRTLAVTILSGWRARLISRRLGLAVSVVVALTVGIGGYYAARYLEGLILLSSVVGSHDFVEDWVKNRRGDKVYIRTDTSPRLDVPDRTVVRLRRAHAWFSATLVAAESFGVQEHLEWINDDTLGVTLGFGCLTHMTHPVETVGPIRISYHFNDGDKTLAKGCPD